MRCWILSMASFMPSFCPLAILSPKAMRSKPDLISRSSSMTSLTSPCSSFTSGSSSSLSLLWKLVRVFMTFSSEGFSTTSLKYFSPRRLTLNELNIDCPWFVSVDKLVIALFTASGFDKSEPPIRMLEADMPVFGWYSLVNPINKKAEIRMDGSTMMSHMRQSRLKLNHLFKKIALNCCLNNCIAEGWARLASRCLRSGSF
mmetsp:Transcript_3730/g.5635  ORF Transcript_3730/g.5635 Transcript_3730/m.5635 type:complete len:201 (+) Transcript_3730:1857-2459(+)